MRENNPDLKFVVPEEGTNWFVDAMCIPKGAANKTNAELFINFMCSKDVCLKNMDATGYTSPNKEAAAEYAATLDPGPAPLMFPPAEVLSRCQIYVNLPPETLKLYDDLWVKLKS